MIKNIFFFVSLTIVNTISSQNYHMRVRIVDANEIQNAINGAYVEVEQLGLVKETDKFGNVGFDDVPQGRITINVTKPNYKKTTEFRFHVSPEEKNNVFEIQLKKIDNETKNTKEIPIILNQTGHIVTAEGVTIANSPVNNTFVQKVETAGFSLSIDSIYFNNKKFDPWKVGSERIIYPLEIDSLLGRCKEVYSTCYRVKYDCPLVLSQIFLISKNKDIFSIRMVKVGQQYPGPNTQYLNIQGYIVSKLQQPASDYYDIQIDSCSPISINRDIVAQKQ